VTTANELHDFADALANVMAGSFRNTQPSTTGLFASVREHLPLNYAELDDITRQDLKIFRLAANPYTKPPDVDKLLWENFVKWRDEFVAASIHSVVSRLFALKLIEDNYCAGQPQPLIEPDLWVINSDHYGDDTSLLPREVRTRIQQLKRSGNQVVQHLAVFGAFFDWIWDYFDAALFRTLFVLFVSHDFSALEHDLLGRFFELYAQAVNGKQRKELGQYYTPLPRKTGWYGNDGCFILS
jgi:type I restriction-modification system DNA methylase subunit